MALADADSPAGFMRSRDSARLAYGLAAALNVFAIVGAWPTFADPIFGYLALGLTLVGVPISVWLRREGVSRRRVNLLVLGAALFTGAIVLTRLPIPSLNLSYLLRYMLIARESTHTVFLIHSFLWVAMFRSFTLLEDDDLPLCIVPAVSTMILVSILSRTLASFACFLGVVACAVVLLELDQRRREAARARLAHLAPVLEMEVLRRVLVMLLIALLGGVPLGIGFSQLYPVRNLAWALNNMVMDYVRTRTLDWAASTLIMPYPSVELRERAASGTQVLFRVQAGADLFWRSNCFDTYNGQGWRHGPAHGRLATLQRRGPATYAVPALDTGEPETPAAAVSQTYEPVSYFQASLPAAYEPVQVSGPVIRPRRSDEGVLTTGGYLRRGQRYQVVSVIKPPPSPPLGGSARLDEAARRRYLALPPVPARLRKLAADITTGQPDDLRRAHALRSYLREKLRYAKQVRQPPPGRDGADWFVFETKEGYCDYFATAMVVMCRCVGVPARFATGYVTGQVTPDDWYEVRAENAHSLAEVFIAGYGWLELDPSPAVEESPGTVATAVTWARTTWQSARRALTAWWRASVSSPTFPLKLAGLIALLAAAGASVHLLRRERLPPLPRRHGPGEERRFVIAGYQAMVHWFASWGVPKPPGTTAAEFAARLHQSLGELAGPAGEVVSAYQHARYGHRPVTREAAASAAQALLALLRHKRTIKRQLAGLR